MEKEIVLGGQLVPYVLKESKRAKYVNVTLNRDGSVVVSLPIKTKETEAENFLKKKERWILSHLKEIENDVSIYIPNHKGKEFELLREFAGIFIKKKVEETNKYYNFKINKISIKNQKTQWGSCSIKKNLNFTYKLVFLPERLAKYVITHEICHLKEFSHNVDFWELVKKSIPNYKELNKELLNYHLR